MDDGLLIAIHHTPGGFSDRWLAYARQWGYPVRIVDAYRPDIFAQLEGCAAFLWHWEHWRPEAVAAARRILPAVERRGLAVFPDTNTCWHYDDKIAQWYLMESLGIATMPTVVFYDRAAALAWAAEATFPKVFKLACGAGGRNVRLVRSRREAEALIRRAFGRGFRPFGGIFSDARTRLEALGRVAGAGAKARKVWAYVRKVRRINRGLGRERGYVYFQEYVPQPGYDVRMTVIGGRAFALLKGQRPGDFRASGSGRVCCDSNRVPLACVRTALEASRRLGAQCLAFDMWLGPDGEYVIGEFSYCFPVDGVIHACPGYWDDALEWHPGHYHPEDLIFEDVLARVVGRRLSADRARVGLRRDSVGLGTGGDGAEAGDVGMSDRTVSGGADGGQ